MARATSSFSLQVPVTAIKIFDKNPYRLLYSIQNLGATDIAIGKNGVTVAVYGSLEGQHLAAGQPMSDDTDQDEVWAIAQTAPVNIAVVEISDRPSNPTHLRSLRLEERRELRREARTF
jgi:hypothetical protein